MADHADLRYTLDLAKTCVHQGQAHQALEHLRRIKLEIDDLVGDSLWAEHELIYAGALAAMNQGSAETAFEDALKRTEALSNPDLLLAMRVHGDYAKYLAGRCATKRARQQFQQAEKIAETLNREESVAHFQMCVIRLDLQETDDPRLQAFQRLQEAAKDGYHEVQQREAWIHYNEELGGIGLQLVATRKGMEGSVEYFRGVLSKIRRGR
jgi:tetratricopeptide (TPR) repeat protein